MKKHHPKIHVIYKLTNYTSIYQPTDVILQHIFEHSFCQEFNKYIMNNITKQWRAKIKVYMDFKDDHPQALDMWLLV
jgi:hypothetical protein